MKKWNVIGLLLAFSCGAPSPPQAERLIQEAILAHQANYDSSLLTFHFRDRNYKAQFTANGYVYTRSWEDSLGRIEDVLVNSTEFHRLINGDTVSLNAEEADAYASSVNSVLYFFRIPDVLDDPGAIAHYEGTADIEDEPYFAVEITFQAEGGGEDYQDIFMYWIHQSHKTIDYMAYSYLTEGGGVRFRKSINRRRVGGVWVQDYINYKAPKGTLLSSLPDLFESGHLEEVSRIINKDVRIERITL
jgi:hypothetical protein